MHRLTDPNSPDISGQGLIPLRQWKAVCPSLAVLTFKNNAVICHQGEPQTQGFYVVSGHVKLSRVTMEGQEFIIAILSTGEIFGALSTGSDSDKCQETALAKGHCPPLPVSDSGLHGSATTARHPQFSQTGVFLEAPA